MSTLSNHSRLAGSSILALLAIGGLAQAAPQEQVGVTQLRNQHQRAIERERAEGIERIQLGSGRYQLRLPDGLQTEEVREENGVYWIYEGQEVFTDLPEERIDGMVYVEPEQEQTEVDQLLGSVSVDRYGRRWSLQGVDEAAMQDAIRAYDELVAGEFGLEAPELEPASPEPAQLDPGGWAHVTNLSWSQVDCDGDGGADTFLYGGDNRSLSSNLMSVRQRKVVLISTPGGRGSGVMVDDEWLLTAAHVITTSGGSFYNPSTYDIVTYGNYQTPAETFTADCAVMPGGYSGDGDINDDYAVVRLTSRPGVGWMAISSASNSTIKSADAYNVGYPGSNKGTGCSSTSATSIHGGHITGEQFWSKGNLFGTTSRKIKTRVDIAKGHSGGPFYYYPSGCCGSHYITGVNSAFVNPAIGSSYTGGPKGSAIRTWVITNTP